MKHDWTGTGDYYVFLSILNSEGSTEKLFVYTGGVTPNQDGSNVPKRNFTDLYELTTLSFTSFLDGSTLLDLLQSM
jgi:hypothetical protein